MNTRRIFMKNGDIEYVQSFDWSQYKDTDHLLDVVNELRAEIKRCRSQYPDRKIAISFNSVYGAVPEIVRKALETARVKVQEWP